MQSHPPSSLPMPRLQKRPRPPRPLQLLQVQHVCHSSQIFSHTAAVPPAHEAAHFISTVVFTLQPLRVRVAAWASRKLRVVVSEVAGEGAGESLVTPAHPAAPSRVSRRAVVGRVGMRGLTPCTALVSADLPMTTAIADGAVAHCTNRAMRVATWMPWGHCHVTPRGNTLAPARASVPRQPAAEAMATH